MTIIAAADGSALGNPGPAGWAWYVDENCWAAGGWPESTNNRGELTAVLELLQATAHTGEDLLIQADSQYVINSLTKWRHGWKKRGWRKADGKPVLNDDLMKQLDAALAGRVVHFEWVRGHVGHPMNEAADTRARGAATAYQRGLAVPSGPGWTRGGGGSTDPSPRKATTASTPASPASSRQAVVPGATAARRAQLRAQQEAAGTASPPQVDTLF
ncbi:Ribonuclease HI [Actinomyces bovis]|uniref:Ribonuclease H n=1 Tax=Actinomyces bovis TaxID=1658 RepID=A0ABY1VMD2_9ACTO|nr:ribonuclease H [Actinomyces bovis]SPT52847.1 Ribonuclease HI [Actinomyces bovis]VEG54934.1 Ribonuclease HI [Actinomyces israelii]